MAHRNIESFQDYIGVQEEHLVSSIANLGKHFWLVWNLDNIYRKTTEYLEPLNIKELKTPAFLYLLTHSEFCSGMASLLRLNRSSALTSLRIALDCTFTAYYILKNPDKDDLYRSRQEDKEENPDWKKIFLSIKSTIKKQIEDFPLAKNLPEAHEFCSIHAHADPIGIFNRYIEDKDAGKLEAKYFDSSHDPKEYLAYVVYFCFHFFHIYNIYWVEMFHERFGENRPAMETLLKGYYKAIVPAYDSYWIDYMKSLTQTE